MPTSDASGLRALLVSLSQFVVASSNSLPLQDALLIGDSHQKQVGAGLLVEKAAKTQLFIDQHQNYIFLHYRCFYKSEVHLTYGRQTDYNYKVESTMLSSLKISHKLTLMVFVAVLSFVGSQVFKLVAERNNSDRLQRLEQKLYPTLELSTVNLGLLSLIELQINSAVTTGDETQLEATREDFQTIKQNLSRISELNPSLAGETEALSTQFGTYYSTATQIASSFIDGTADFSAIGKEASKNADRLSSVRNAMTEMRKTTRSRFTGSISQTLEASEKASTVSIVIMLAATFALVGLSLIIGRSISCSLGEIISSLKEMASGEGDLTSRLDYQGKDELREVVNHFNAFVEKLHRSFAAISEDVTGLNSVSANLTTASDQNLKRIREQTEAIASARLAVDELVKSVEEVAGFASSASDQTQDAANLANTGHATVSSNVTTINALLTDIEDTAKLVNRFEEFSGKVGGLLNTIQTVADQTNLLALNAAIEAARAGEHGRGFAVVADEVRGLAVRTRNATEEIHSVIGDLTQISGSAISSMHRSVEKAREGAEATTQSGEMLQRILENVEAISSINEQIAAATYEQSTTFSSVNEHIKVIHDNADHVSASTRELDTVTNEIRKITGGLSNVASQFRV